MTDTDYLDILKKEISRHEDWPDYDTLSGYYFERLSENIKNKTQVDISPLTLGRIYGKIKHAKNVYNPQIATKNAMAQYLGYESWENFRQHIKNKKTLPIIKSRYRLSEKAKKILLYSLSFLLVMGLLLFLKTKWQNHHQEIKFICTTPILTAPNTFTFEYDISSINDSVFVKYGNKEKHLKPNNNFLTIYIAEPSLNTLTLYSRKKTLASVSYKAITNGWNLIIEGNEKIIEYADSSIITNSRMTINQDQIMSKGFNINEKHLMHFINFREFNVSCDSMMVSTRFRTIESTSCNSFSLTFSGKTNDGFVQLVPEKCFRWAVLKIAEKKLYGENYNLKNLGQNLEDWKTIDIKTRNKKIYIYIDSLEIFQTDYRDNLGSLFGLTYSWSCCGEIDWVKLYNASDSIIYQDDF